MTEVIKIDVNERYVIIIETETALHPEMIDEQARLFENWVKSGKTFHILNIVGDDINIRFEKVTNED